jgi:acyl-coenzyme A synthetase/AMP-(fatty) acid ligase
MQQVETAETRLVGPRGAAVADGQDVYPAEIEAVLSSHDAVAQCAVVGRAVAGNEEVVAFVQLLKGANASPHERMAHIAPHLTSS